MTVSSTTSRWEYVGDGATTAFTVNGKCFETSDIKVYLAGVLQTISTHYTVALNGDQDSNPGGTVTFLTAPVLAASVIIVRDVPATQIADLPLAGPLPSAPVEDALDRAMIVAQQLLAAVARSIRFPVTDDDALTSELGAAAARAGMLLGFDAEGDVVLTAAAVGPALVTPFMATVLDDADGTTARTTLGALASADLRTILSRSDNVLASHKNLVVKFIGVQNVDIDADEVVLQNSVGDLKHCNVLNRTLDLTATGIDGLDTGSEAPSTWYHIWAIATDAGVLRGLLSASASAPTLPATYTHKGYLGAVYNDGSSNFVAFFQRGNHVSQKSTDVLAAGIQTNFTAVSLAAVVPPTATSVAGDATIDTSSGTADITGVIAPAGATTTATYGSVSVRGTVTTNDDQRGHFRTLLSTVQQLMYRVSGTNGQLTLAVSEYWY